MDFTLRHRQDLARVEIVVLLLFVLLKYLVITYIRLLEWLFNRVVYFLKYLLRPRLLVPESWAPAAQRHIRFNIYHISLQLLIGTATSSLAILASTSAPTRVTHMRDTVLGLHSARLPYLLDFGDAGVIEYENVTGTGTPLHQLPLQVRQVAAPH